MKSSLGNESGNALMIVVAALLVVIAGALIFGAWSSEKIAHAKKCEMGILKIQAHEHQWQTVKGAGKPDAKALCDKVNAMLGEYNNGDCGQDFGTLPDANCD